MIRQNIKNSLKAIIAKYLQDNGITDSLNFTLEVPPGNIDADIALNTAMLIAKKVKANPKTVAQELIDITVKEIPDLIEKAEIAGAGLINLRIKNEILYKELEDNS